MTIAAKIAAPSPVAVQLTKRVLNHLMKKATIDSFEFSMALEQSGMERRDLREAVDAFKEKRKPTYSDT